MLTEKQNELVGEAIDEMGNQLVDCCGGHPYKHTCCRKWLNEVSKAMGFDPTDYHDIAYDEESPITNEQFSEFAVRAYIVYIQDHREELDIDSEEDWDGIVSELLAILKLPEFQLLPHLPDLPIFQVEFNVVG